MQDLLHQFLDSVRKGCFFLLFPNTYASPCAIDKKSSNFPPTRTSQSEKSLFINIKILGCPKNTPENVKVKKETFYSPFPFRLDVAFFTTISPLVIPFFKVSRSSRGDILFKRCCNLSSIRLGGSFNLPSAFNSS